MTDPDPRLDELLSAHLDGETTPEEAARIEREPELAARLGELAAARGALASSAPSLDDAARDATLARVFATLDRDDTPASLTPITELGRRRRDPSRFLAAAAAVIAVVLLGGAITMLERESGDQSDGGDSAATGLSTEDDAGARSPATLSEQDADAAGEAEADNGSELVPPGAVLPSLGRFDDTAQLAARVRDELLSARSGASEDSAESTTAAQLVPDLPSCPAPPDSRAVFTAEVDGRFLYVVLSDEPDALVIDPQTCTEVLRITPQ
jgi:negative regulator of sigma E activity